MDFALGILWVEEEDREREIYNSVAVTRSFGNNVHKYRVFVVHRNEQLAQNQEQKDFVILSFQHPLPHFWWVCLVYFYGSQINAAKDLRKCILGIWIHFCTLGTLSVQRRKCSGRKSFG